MRKNQVCSGLKWHLEKILHFLNITAVAIDISKSNNICLFFLAIFPPATTLLCCKSKRYVVYNNTLDILAVFEEAKQLRGKKSFYLISNPFTFYIENDSWPHGFSLHFFKNQSPVTPYQNNAIVTL